MSVIFGSEISSPITSYGDGTRKGVNWALIVLAYQRYYVFPRTEGGGHAIMEPNTRSIMHPYTT